MFNKSALQPLEEKIEFLAKEFYSIPQDDETYVSKRDRQKTLLITALLEYYKKTFKSDFQKYSSTIFFALEDTSKKDENKKIGVIANYSPEKGNFLNYCNRSVKMQIQHENNHEKGNDMEMDENKNYNEDEIQYDNDFGYIAEITEKLQIIETEFIKKQVRIKPYLSALLTHKCYTLLLKIAPDFFSGLSFIDKKLFDEIRENPKLKQQDVAKKFGRDKTDASRTLKNFLDGFRLLEN